MRNWPFWLTYEDWIDFINLDFTWFEDIAKALCMSNETSLNLLCLPEKVQEKIQSLKPVNWISDNTQIAIILKMVLTELWIKSYEIIYDREVRLKDDLRVSWARYFWSINNFWDFNINSIKEHINPWDWTISRSSFTAKRFDGPYVIFYNKLRPSSITDNLVMVVKQKQRKLLDNN